VASRKPRLERAAPDCPSGQRRRGYGRVASRKPRLERAAPDGPSGQRRRGYGRRAHVTRLPALRGHCVRLSQTRAPIFYGGNGPAAHTEQPSVSFSRCRTGAALLGVLCPACAA
jgi:hypothetical protein